MGINGEDLLGDGIGAVTDWFQNLVSEFSTSLVTYVITVVALGVGLLFVSILTHGKVIKIKRVIKIVINCLIGYGIMFIIGAVGGFFTGGVWTFMPKAWYSWVLLGLFGILAVIFFIISMFVWPGVFVETAAAA